MPSARTVLIYALLLGPMTVGVRPATAQSYLPLAVGNHWEYATTDGRHETQRISGTKSLNGHTVYVKLYEASSENEGLENYWTEDADGRLLLHGFWLGLSGWGILYEPPLVLADAPLSPGKTWTCSMNPYRLPEMEPLEPWIGHFEVVESGEVETPAGTFFAYGVSNMQLVGMLAERRVTADGRVVRPDGTVATASVQATDWYSPGLGEVRYYDYYLTGYGFPTPALASSWGRLKSLYR